LIGEKRKPKHPELALRVFFFDQALPARHAIFRHLECLANAEIIFGAVFTRRDVE
jgi:hypothetical protein